MKRFIYRDEWDRFIKHLRKDTEVVHDNVQFLIDACYIVVKEGGTIKWKVREDWLIEHDIEDANVNWGHLYCGDVKKFEDGTYAVYVAEGDCRKFERYIAEEMKKAGWDVEVRTEW